MQARWRGSCGAGVFSSCGLIGSSDDSSRNFRSPNILYINNKDYLAFITNQVGCSVATKQIGLVAITLREYMKMIQNTAYLAGAETIYLSLNSR